jgi:mannitol-1-phosphate/altronate dehydrogenase
MDVNEIKQFIESNRDSDEVRGFLNSLTPSFDQAMENPDFAKAMKSFADKEGSRQVEAFKNKTLPSTIEDEVKKRLEAQNHKEPWQIKLEEMEKQQNQLMEQLKQKERSELIQKNKNQALKTLTDKKLPSDILDYLVSDEQEKTNSSIEAFVSMMDNYTTNLKQDLLKSNNVRVPGQGETFTGGAQEPGEGASKAEWKAYWASQKK